jgi:hypothetical protein
MGYTHNSEGINYLHESKYGLTFEEVIAHLDNQRKIFELIRDETIKPEDALRKIRFLQTR